MITNIAGDVAGRMVARLGGGVVLVVLAGCLLLGAFPDGAWAGFGVTGFSAATLNGDGSPATQAGAHPFEISTTVQLNTSGPEENEGNAKDIVVELPAGVVGSATASPQCTDGQLVGGELGVNECPPDSQVGYIVLLGTPLGGDRTIPVFNMVPPPGEPAQLGFNPQVPVYIDLHVRSGGDYGLTATSSDISTLLSITGVSLVVWGVPADPAHDPLRGTGALCEGEPSSLTAPTNCPGGGHSAGIDTRPLMTLPTQCAGPQTLSLSTDSWQEIGVFAQASAFLNEDGGDPLGFDGCNQLAFTPSLSLLPESSVADSPTGLQVDVHLPQAGLQDPEALSEADLRNAVVTLPAGVSVNPSVANGLAACSPGQVALSSPAPAVCPEASKIGSVEVNTPILGHALKGGVYVAEQGNNPFSSLLAIYVAVNDPETGIVIKLAGHIVADPVTGQLTTVFDDAPQQPFTDFKLDFFGGPRAALVNPDACGAYATSSQLTPWSSETPAEPGSSFEINAGCHAPQFAPAFTAGTVTPQAGAFSPLTVSLSRSDQDQVFSGVSLTTPPGLLGVLKGVERCGEPQASQGTCGAGSLIGHATAAAGAGGDPVSTTGEVFLTGPYKGAPFGLSMVVPAAVGPFNLGTVVVRAAVSVDPHTAQITVSSDALPSILQGVPLRIKSVNVSIDRPGFIFNPTDCEPLSAGGTLTSAQGATVGVSSHFQAANCATLPFKPAFTVSTQAATSKKNGASLLVKGAFPTGEANIHSVAVTLPKQLPARLTTIQQACTEAVFNANPASCPIGSNIGTATANTQILAVPLTGPVYLVSHGGAAFPDIVAILQGEGVTVDLTGSIDIKHNITSSTFATVPDAPISTFTLTLPEGPHSGLAAVVPAKAKGDMCGQSLTMPFTITGQNGAVVKENNKIAVTGCPRVKKKGKPKPKHPKKAGKKK